MATDAEDGVVQRWVMEGMSSLSCSAMDEGVEVSVVASIFFDIATDLRVVGPPRRVATVAGTARQTLATVEADMAM